MTPEQLLANMLDVYASSGTYRDVGRLLKYFMPVGYEVERRPSAVEFRTAYARPGRLRFEERHYHTNGECFSHKISWADRSDVRRWTHRDRSLRPRNLLGAFSAVIHTVHPVVGLLTEGQVEGGLTNLTRPILLPDEVLEGVACHRVRCRCSWWDYTPTPEEQSQIDNDIEFLTQVTGMSVPPGRTVHLPLTVWIDCGTLLIRRVESRTITDRASHEQVMTCQPEVGVALDPVELLFDPPDPLDTSGESG